MRAARIVVFAVALVLLAGPAGCDLNLKGQTRYTVDDVTYGITEIAAQGSVVEVSLARVRSESVGPEEAAAIEAVEGIVLVNEDNERLPVTEIGLEPSEGEHRYVVLVFDVGERSGPWTLEWPGHDPFPLGL